VTADAIAGADAVAARIANAAKNSYN